MVFLFLVSFSIAYSGTHYWNEGELVRAPKINYALDEKADIAGEAYVTLTPQIATPTPAMGRMFIASPSGQLIYHTISTWTVAAP